MHVELSVGTTKTRIRNIRELLHAFAQHACSITELAGRDPEEFARITKFLLFPREDSGHVIGGRPELNEAVAIHFGVDVVENRPRLVGNTLHYLIRFTAADDGLFIRPVIPEEMRVLSVSVDLSTGDTSWSEIQRITG